MKVVIVRFLFDEADWKKYREVFSDKWIRETLVFGGGDELEEYYVGAIEARERSKQQTERLKQQGEKK